MSRVVIGAFSSLAPEQSLYWFIVGLTIWNEFQCNWNQNVMIFIQENAKPTVACNMAVISSKADCVNYSGAIQV